MLEIDLRHRGCPRTICCYADLDEGWLVDPGPDSAHEHLLAHLPDGWSPQRILLTHIHLDHAGSAGRLASRWPQAEIWVHERGARHLADPARLVASARRIYGDEFDELWGAVLPVPAERIRTFAGDERRQGWRVTPTPGHASHHLSYLHEATGVAMAGDVAGVRIGDGPVILSTPPPDIDREQWHASLASLRDWAPAALAVAHFGTWPDVEAHLDAVAMALARWSELARRTTQETFAEYVRAFVRDSTADPALRESYEQSNPAWMLWGGWARYWSLRDLSAPR